jgi:hypothetical protein
MRVSDHALVRYLERAKGVSLDHLREELQLKVLAKAGKDATGCFVDGLWFVITNGVVVTAMTAPPYARAGNKKHVKKRRVLP